MATPPWKFVSNHGAVLICVARDPGVRIRDLAAELEITERAVQRILGDLIESGYVSRTKSGRRNSYLIRTELPLPDRVARQLQLGEVLDVFVNPPDRKASRGSPNRTTE